MIVFSKYQKISAIVVASVCYLAVSSPMWAYWVWTPESKKWVNPKYAVKDSPQEQFDWAKSFYEQGQSKRALKEFRKLVNEFPKSSLAPEALYFSGEIFMKINKPYDAFIEYQKVVEKYPGTKRVADVIERQVQIGNHFFHQNLKVLGVSVPAYDRAVEVFIQVVKNAPYGPMADYAQFHVAESYRLLSKYNEAIQAYQELVRKFPQSSYVAEARYKIALSSTGASPDYAYTEEEKKKAVAEFETYMAKEQQSSRVQEVRQEIENLEQGEVDKLWAIAEQYEKVKEYKAAHFYYKQIYDKHPNNPKITLVKQKMDELEPKIIKAAAAPVKKAKTKTKAKA